MITCLSQARHCTTYTNRGGYNFSEHKQHVNIATVHNKTQAMNAPFESTLAERSSLRTNFIHTTSLTEWDTYLWVGQLGAHEYAPSPGLMMSNIRQNGVKAIKHLCPVVQFTLRNEVGGEGGGRGRGKGEREEKWWDCVGGNPFVPPSRAAGHLLTLP